MKGFPNMQCPIDQTTLVMTERQGVEIDYCPTCRGVWLDRGELDKILERAHGDMPGVRSNAPRGNLERTADTRPQATNLIGKLTRAVSDRDGGESGQPRKKKRDSFLDDLFDF